MADKSDMDNDTASGIKRHDSQLSDQPQSKTLSTEIGEIPDAQVPSKKAEASPGSSKKLAAALEYQKVCNRRYLDDQIRFLDVFPEEVWLLIFEKLENPSHLEKLSNNNLFFRELLLSQRQTFMFPSVWKILASKYEKYVGANVDKTAKGLQEILKLRLVCREWCNGIDNFYQNHPDHYKMSPDKNMSINADKSVVRKLGLKVVEWMEEFRFFTGHFSKTHQATGRSPFIGKSLELILNKDDDDSFKRTVQRILEKYGGHIWYCELRIHRPLPSTTDAYTRMREALCWMPNLKVLTISNARFPTGKDPEELQLEIDSNPLPAMQQLDKLQCGWLPTPVYKELVCRNNHVSTLDIVYQQKPTFGVNPVDLVKNLQTLAVTFRVGEEYLNNIPLGSPVTTLYLGGMSCYWFDWMRMYQMLESRFKNTLTSLHVSLPELRKKNREILVGAEVRTLDLPHLTHVELSLGTLASLDILLPLSNTLTVLNVYILVQRSTGAQLKDAEEVENGACIDFFKCVLRGRPLESNVWTKFGKLKSLSFKYVDNVGSFRCSHNRIEWNERMKVAQNVNNGFSFF